MLLKKVLQLVTLQEGTNKKRSISYYTAEVTDDFNGCDCEIVYYKWLENINKFILDKKNMKISAFLLVTYYGSLHQHH